MGKLLWWADPGRCLKGFPSPWAGRWTKATVVHGQSPRNCSEEEKTTSEWEQRGFLEEVS